MSPGLWFTLGMIVGAMIGVVATAIAMLGDDDKLDDLDKLD